jgi:hypothetical protein
MSVLVGSARIDENGKVSGGKAGDQTGKEVSTQNWYLHSKGWRVFRLNDSKLAIMLAKVISDLCANNHVGYNQSENTDLWNKLKALNWDWTKLEKDCNTDCAQLVRAALRCVGINTDFFTTSNEPEGLLKTGKFTELKGTEYTNSSIYLKAGDILCTKTKGHTVVVLNDGEKADKNISTEKLTYTGAFAAPTLKQGSKGNQVGYLQKFLNWYGNYSLAVDNSFGSKTLAALKDFQLKEGLTVDGSYGPKSYAKAKTIKK